MEEYNPKTYFWIAIIGMFILGVVAGIFIQLKYQLDNMAYLISGEDCETEEVCEPKIKASTTPFNATDCISITNRTMDNFTYYYCELA